MPRPPRAGGAGRPSERLTSGPILGSLVALAGPIVLANVFQTVYQLTDTFWVGRLGANAVAAVSLSFPVIFLLIALGGGLAIAGTILVAQYEGRGEPEQVDHVAAQTLLLVTAVSVGISVVGYLLAPTTMRIVGAEPGVFEDAVGYLRVTFAGMVFLFVYIVFQSLMRGVGDVKTPLWIVGGTVLLNFVLDPLFIMGWGPVPALGVSGAALATVGTQGLASFIGLGVLFSGRYGIHLRLSALRPDGPLAWRMLRLGFPASVEQSTRALGIGVMTVLVASLGSGTVAAYGIGTRFLSFVIIPALGLSMATSTLVGQNLGARQPERAARVAWIGAAFGFAAMTAVGAVFFVAARPLVAAFIPNEPAVIEEGAHFLRVIALSFGFIGLQQVLGGAFVGAGRTLVSMVLAIVSLWVLRFPLAYLLVYRFDLGADGIWWAFPVANVVAGLVALAWFARGDWKRGRLPTDEDEVVEDQTLEDLRIKEGLP